MTTKTTSLDDFVKLIERSTDRGDIASAHGDSATDTGRSLEIGQDDGEWIDCGDDRSIEDQESSGRCDIYSAPFHPKFDHRIVDEEKRILSARINTLAVDTFGTVILPNGARLSAYRKNPVVLFNHNPDEPIGKTLRVRKTDHFIDAEWQMAKSANPNARVNHLWELVTQKILRGYSIGFLPLERSFEDRDKQDKKQFGPTITKWDMREFSLTPTPSNPEALQRNASLLQHWRALTENTTKIYVPQGADEIFDHANRSATDTDTPKENELMSNEKELAIRIDISGLDELKQDVSDIKSAISEVSSRDKDDPVCEGCTRLESELESVRSELEEKSTELSTSTELSESLKEENERLINEYNTLADQVATLGDEEVGDGGTE